MNAIVWLPPLLFILHDMEEIIFVMRWKRKDLAVRRMKGRAFTPFGNFKTTEGLSLAVYEELILLTLASLLGTATGHYELWLGFLAANILHLALIHLLGMVILYRSYVPGAVTALITLIPCCMVFYKAVGHLHYPFPRLLLAMMLGVITAAVNLNILHRCGNVFEAFISKAFE